MTYYEIYAWTECPFCKDAKDLLIKKKQQFMFCTLDSSDDLLKYLKSKYNWNTVPMILKCQTDKNEKVFIGGFTDLKEVLEEQDE